MSIFTKFIYKQISSNSNPTLFIRISAQSERNDEVDTETDKQTGFKEKTVLKTA